MAWRMLVLGLVAAAVAAGARADEPVLLDDALQTAAGHWREDDRSRFDGQGYVLTAPDATGYARWLDAPLPSPDVRLAVDAELLQGGPDASYGILVRVGDTLTNAYAFLLTGGGGYRLVRLGQGQAGVLRSGLVETLSSGGRHRLELLAEGDRFEFAVDGRTVGTATDGANLAAGRVGLLVSGPASVRFARLLASRPMAAGAAAPPPPLLAEGFESAGDWPTDAHRQIRDGAFHFVNSGEAGSFMTWCPATGGLRDYRARVDARRVAGGPGGSFGLLWRVQDELNYYYLLINPDGRYFAGRCQDGVPAQAVAGRSVGIRPEPSLNSLEVIAVGDQHRLLINGALLGTFRDNAFTEGAVGFYVQGASDVAFDDLFVTAETPARPAPGPLTATAAGPAVPASVVDDPLSTNSAEARWPTDDFHAFESGGLVVRAPESGSRTSLRGAPLDLADGTVSVVCSPLAGPVQAAYGLVARASADGQSFYFLLLSGSGKYFVGRCLAGRYSVLASGPVDQMRGGDHGNRLWLRLDGAQLAYGLNETQLGRLADDQLRSGRVGLHVENGIVACFRDLRVGQ